MNIKKYIGDKAFYRMALAIAIPLILQNGVTNLMNLLSNLMAGSLGTEQVSGVSIVNQLVFVYNLSLFGGISAANIFGTQFYGKGDHEGQRNVFRVKLLLALALLALGTLVFAAFDDQLISLYLHQSESAGDLALTLQEGKAYLRILLVSLIPFTIAQVYRMTLWESAETLASMKASFVATGVNIALSYVLVYGKLGLPAMGVRGAALALVFSRAVEAGIIVLWTHKRFEHHPFILDAYKTFRVPAKLVADIARRGWPLLLNETLWSMGLAVLWQCYSQRGLAVIAGVNIATVMMNLFNVVLIAFGNCISILVGNQLGANRIQEAKDSDTKLVAFSFACCIALGFIMMALSRVFPALYNTTSEVRALAQRFIFIQACFLPINALCNAASLTLRTGGKTIATFFLDGGFYWLVLLPTAYLLVRFSSLDIVSIFFCVVSVDLLKCVAGLIMLKKGLWLNNLISD